MDGTKTEQLTLKPEQAARLGQLIRSRREQAGMTIRDLAEDAEMNFATVSRIEQGKFATPRHDKLARIAQALGLNTADVFALADYTLPADLPSFQPYLRSKYRDMPAAAVDELTAVFQRITKKHGYVPEGSHGGEDETP